MILIIIIGLQDDTYSDIDDSAIPIDSYINNSYNHKINDDDDDHDKNSNSNSNNNNKCNNESNNNGSSLLIIVYGCESEKCSKNVWLILTLYVLNFSEGT